MGQKCLAGQYVLVFRDSAGALVFGTTKGLPIARTPSIVDRQDDKALGSQVLIHRVAVVVVIHVVPSWQHLAHGAAMNEDDRRMAAAVTARSGLKKLTMHR